MTIALFTFFSLVLGLIVGAYLTHNYYSPGIKLYQGAKDGEYNIIIVDVENPRQWDVAMLLHKGDIELQEIKAQRAADEARSKIKVVEDE